MRVEDKVNTRYNWSLWRRWVVANALAEMLGLGTTFAIGVAIFALLGEPQGPLAALGMILLMTSTGAIEGVVVGLLQWWAMRPRFPGIPRKAWVTATLIGALVAWFLGSLPSTLMGLGAQEADVAAQGPEMWVILLLAGGMGLFLGIVLGLPQWRVLRRAVPRAWLWLPANSAAWALGMPLIFAAVDVAQRAGTTVGTVAIILIALALTGAVVGAVHGLALVQLAKAVDPRGTGRKSQ